MYLRMATVLLELLTVVILVVASNAATYSVTDSVSGSGFLSAFSHESISDPTGGRVNYVTQSVALTKNLTFASGDTFIMRADHTTVLSPGGPGRDSVRILSNKKYSTHVVVMNIRHMPEGCATWPAAWEVGANWPNGGEVDIVEGVNNVSPNQATLHTSSGCVMPASRDQTGTTVGATDCNGACGVLCDKANSFASGFNNAGGGWYAMERTNYAIKVWFWSRTDRSVPADVRNGAHSINTSNWGTPFANFPNTSCDISSHFAPNNIVINLTFCGNWAGNTFTAQGCGRDCAAFVNNNPSAFTKAYWDFASLHVYQ